MGTQYDYTCPNCSKECFVDEALIGQNITCPFCAKEFFATPPNPMVPESSEAGGEISPHLTALDKLPFFKGHRRKLLEERFDQMLQSGPIDDNAKEKLAAFVLSVNLDPSEVTSIQHERFTEEFIPIQKRIEASMWLTDEDIAEQKKLEAKYGIQANLAGDAAIFRDIYLLESKGQLPAPISTGLMLEDRESAYYYTSTTWQQSRIVKHGYAGTSASIPTGISGVRFRFGGYTPIQSEEITPLSAGLLYVTSKRLLFNGDRRNTTVNLTKIVNGELYTDALKIEKSTGKPDYFTMRPAEGRYILGLIGKLK